MTGRDLLISLSLKYHGDWDAIMAAIKRKEMVDYDLCLRWREKISSRAVTLLDLDYPQALKEVPKPPLVLFYYGDLSLVQEKKECVSYVGSRKASEYGVRMTKEICSSLAKEGVSVVSGLAYGIDKAAAEGSYPYGKAVAVLGNGIDYYYPSEHSLLQRQIASKGLLLSEYPDKTPPKPEQFPMRNRIIAALSQLTVVGEAGQHSGTLITVAHALNIGRDVCCLPAEADKDSYCNLLIQEGAPLIQNAEDVLFLLGRGEKNPLS